MPFKDTKEGTTHSQNDGCEEPAHNDSSLLRKKSMKILKIIADRDYAALTFEEKFSEQKVSDIIAQVETGKKLTYKDEENDGEVTELQVRIYEVGDIDERFLKFVRDEIQDYDDSKSSNFYLETQTL